MEVQGERKDEDRGPSYEGGYLYSDILSDLGSYWSYCCFSCFYLKNRRAMQSQRCSIRQAYTLRR